MSVWWKCLPLNQITQSTQECYICPGLHNIEHLLSEDLTTPQNSLQQAEGISVPNHWSQEVLLPLWTFSDSSCCIATLTREPQRCGWSAAKFEARLPERKGRLGWGLHWTRAKQLNRGTYTVNNRDDNFAHFSALAPLKQFCSILCPYS